MGETQWDKNNFQRKNNQGTINWTLPKDYTSQKLLKFPPARVKRLCCIGKHLLTTPQGYNLAMSLT